jgi:hypothetical protein
MAFGVTPGQGASTAAEIALLERTRAYLAAIEQDTDVAANPAPGGALAFYHPATNEALPPLGRHAQVSRLAGPSCGAHGRCARQRESPPLSCAVRP